MIAETRTKSLPVLFVALLVATVATLAGAAVARGQTPGPSDARFSTSAEYLLWWLKDSPAAPPLLATGQVGDLDYRAVFGGRDYDTGGQQGGRFTAAYRLTSEWSVEGTGFFLADTSVTTTVASSGAPGSPRLGAPQFRVDEAREGFLALARPGDFFGDARQSLTSGMHGAELNVGRRLATGGTWRMDLLGGFRYLRLHEQLAFSASSVAIADNDLFHTSDVFMPTDVFDADNRFYGGQLGVRGELERGRWFAQGTAKVALGVVHQSVEIAGSLLSNDFNGFGTPQTFAGGLFAQPSNSGRHARDRFAVVPEAGLRVGYRLTSWASVSVGYTFLYASAVVRPGPQIDRNVNTTQSMTYQAPQATPPTLTLQGDARPAARFRESDFWAQGLSVGVSFAF